jgi:hypothetical protein
MDWDAAKEDGWRNEVRRIYEQYSTPSELLIPFSGAWKYFGLVCDFKV